MLPSESFGGHKGQKWPKVPRPRKNREFIHSSLNVFYRNQDPIGVRVVFSLKNIVFTGQEKQNTEDLVKNQKCFWSSEFCKGCQRRGSFSTGIGLLEKTPGWFRRICATFTSTSSKSNLNVSVVYSVCVCVCVCVCFYFDQKSWL